MESARTEIARTEIIVVDGKKFHRTTTTEDVTAEMIDGDALEGCMPSNRSVELKIRQLAVVFLAILFVWIKQLDCFIKQVQIVVLGSSGV